VDVITSRWRVGYDEGKVGDILPKSLTERRSFEKVRAGYQTKQKLERPRKSSYKQEEQMSCGEKTRGTVVSFNKIRHEVSNDGPISIQRIISVLRWLVPSRLHVTHHTSPSRAARAAQYEDDWGRVRYYAEWERNLREHDGIVTWRYKAGMGQQMSHYTGFMKEVRTTNEFFPRNFCIEVLFNTMWTDKRVVVNQKESIVFFFLSNHCTLSFG